MTATATADAPIQAPPVHIVHENETFTWAMETWNITRLLRDIASGKLKPRLMEFGREFIEGYSTGVLSLDKSLREAQTKASLLLHVNARDALALPSAALEQPMVLLCPKKGMGMLRIEGDDGHNHVVGDGNHRIARAFFDDVPMLKAYVLSSAQSRKYRLP